MKNILEFQKNMLILTVSSIIGVIYTYATGGVENKGFRVAVVFSTIFGVFYVLSTIFVAYKKKKVAKEEALAEKVFDKKKYYESKEKNKKKSKKRK